VGLSSYSNIISCAKETLRPAKYEFLYKMWKRRYRNYLKQQIGPYACDVDVGPAPSKDMILLTHALSEEKLEQEFHPKSARVQKYFIGGYHTFLSWFGLLEKHGFNVRTMGAVLDMGCGTARLLRHLRCAQGVRLVGCDVNEQCVNWCKTHVPEPEYYVNNLEPPFSFANEADFDLVYAWSVFTHIPLDWQQAWLREIYRILRPGGFFLCTVLGSVHIAELLSEEARATLKKQGHFVLSSDDESASLSTRVGGSGWDVFQTRSEIIRSYGSVFRIVDYQPGRQDLLVLQKPV